MLLLLGSTLVGLWFWRSNAEPPARGIVDYSTFHAWLTEDKVDSVLINGPVIDGLLKAPERSSSLTSKAFRTIRPDGDEALVPLLLDKEVQIRATTEQQPLLIELLMSLLPWVLVIGIALWLSRRTQKMMASGGPLAGILKSKSRKFEKDTAVGVTFDDVAGLKAAKRDLQEVFMVSVPSAHEGCANYYLVQFKFRRIRKSL
jgi:ATP-dependent Zn protease